MSPTDSTITPNRTVTSGIVDTLIGFRAARHVKPVAALRESDKAEHHPHGYMFKEVPDELDERDDPALAAARGSSTDSPSMKS